MAPDFRKAEPPIHPLHAALLAGTVPLFLGGLLSDLGYGETAEPQWSNFAAWLVLGGTVYCGFALLASLIGLFRAGRRRTWRLACFVLLAGTFAVGFVDNFVHSKDAWAMMPTGAVLSAVVTLLALLATVAGFATLRRGDRP